MYVFAICVLRIQSSTSPVPAIWSSDALGSRTSRRVNRLRVHINSLAIYCGSAASKHAGLPPPVASAAVQCRLYACHHISRALRQFSLLLLALRVLSLNTQRMRTCAMSASHITLLTHRTHEPSDAPAEQRHSDAVPAECERDTYNAAHLRSAAASSVSVCEIAATACVQR